MHKEKGMFALLRIVFAWFLRQLLSLRYRVRVINRQAMEGLDGPVLILPNHPGYIDPPIVLSYLYHPLQPRPMFFEDNFRNPVLYPIMVMLEGIRVPDTAKASAESRERAEQAVRQLIEGLKANGRYILWPSGRLSRDGSERLGAARTLATVLAEVPNLTLILVRTRGVYGSRFSTAYTGRLPNMIQRGLEGGLLLLANLIFFAPRRNVTLTLERIKRDQVPLGSKEAVNRWFEAWYNADTPREKPTFVPYHFLFGPRTYEFPPPDLLADVDLSRVSARVRQEVNDLLCERLAQRGVTVTAEQLKPEKLLEELGLDSLDRMELTLQVERRFGFSSEQTPLNIGHLYALAAGLSEGKSEIPPPPPAWFRQPKRDEPVTVYGTTIAEALLRRVQAHPRDTAIADDLAGVLTYERLLVGALLMRDQLGRLPGASVGLMLPASVACDVAFLGLHLAGKLPTMINWTTGPANMAHACKVMDLSHVVTSRAFIDRAGLSPIVRSDGKPVEYVFLEEIRKQVGTFSKLAKLLQVRWGIGKLLRQLPPTRPEQPAVVLFTSGSEKAPKAVPLTHANLFAVMHAGIPVIGLTRRDSILGFLPAFHSFGMSVTGLMPILGGMKMVHHPDPTDAGGLVRKIAAYRPTILAGTPTFISYILDRAEREADPPLRSLRLILVGAEKCPPALVERCAQVVPGVEVLEGYGITECSPVVSVNPPGKNKPGTMGPALPGVQVRVVDLETYQPLPPGERGMILVGGPTIFNGYLAHDGPQPFVERDGQRWYVTGDLGILDQDGYIQFAGRLKRFLKAGGEMISLPALEEPFVAKFPPTQDGPRVAVEGIETEAGRRIVLFTTEPITLSEANALLQSVGFHGIMRLDEVRRVEKIPVLGTGKTDYKLLRAQIAVPADAANAVPADAANAVPADAASVLANGTGPALVNAPAANNQLEPRP
jgi:long-chain-fatty-acid--[acyl-carrier-protein] ligase